MSIPFLAGAKSNKLAQKIKAEAEAKRIYRLKHDIRARGIPFTKEYKESLAIAKKKNAQMLKSGAWKKYLKKETRL